MYRTLGYTKLAFVFKDLCDLPIRSLTSAQCLDEVSKRFKARSGRLLRETVENFVQFAVHKIDLLAGKDKRDKDRDKYGTGAGHMRDKNATPVVLRKPTMQDRSNLSCRLRDGVLVVTSSRRRP